MGLIPLFLLNSDPSSSSSHITSVLLPWPQRLGLKKALVVHSAGLDELTPMAPADVVEVVTGVEGVKRYQLDPLSLGIPRSVNGPRRSRQPICTLLASNAFM